MLFERCGHSSTFGNKTLIKTNVAFLGKAFFGVLAPVCRHLIFLTAISVAPSLLAADMKLYASETESSAGYFSLTWTQAEGHSDVVLQQSTHQAFTPHTSRQWTINNVDSFSMSGLNSGVYYYRVAPFDKPQSWSNVVQVNVQHHSLGKAFFIFAVGATLFSLLSIIIFLNYKNKTSGI